MELIQSGEIHKQPKLLEELTKVLPVVGITNNNNNNNNSNSNNRKDTNATENSSVYDQNKKHSADIPNGFDITKNANFGEFMREKTYKKGGNLQCKICGNMQKDKDNMEQHLNVNHQMDFEI